MIDLSKEHAQHLPEHQDKARVEGLFFVTPRFELSLFTVRPRLTSVSDRHRAGFLHRVLRTDPDGIPVDSEATGFLILSSHPLDFHHDPAGAQHCDNARHSFAWS